MGSSELNEEAPMKDGAPAGKHVRDTGATAMDECGIALPGVCIAEEKGPVKLFHIVDDKQQLHVCLKCFEQLVLAGQWVERS